MYILCVGTRVIILMFNKFFLPLNFCTVHLTTVFLKGTACCIISAIFIYISVWVSELEFFSCGKVCASV
jgi:hypothetical protein